jgi:ABC-type taurine transport system ATPase subunit
MTEIELSGIILAVGSPRAGHEGYEIAPDPFGVAAGQTGVIVAPPEAKTALADVLTGLAAPISGEVYVRGAAVAGLAPGSRGIALVPAGGGLLPHLTVERNAGYALAGAGTREQRRARVEEVLGWLELTSLRRLRPHELSAEQRLRVAVARAMCLPGGASAVVVEDCGTAACRAAVTTAAGQELAVVVITGTSDRAVGLGGPVPPQAQALARAVACCRPVWPVGVAPDASQR